MATENLENKQTTAPGVNADEVSLTEIVDKIKNTFGYILSKWKLIVLIGLIGGGLGFAYASFKKPVYTASTTFVLEEGGSAGGGMAGQYANLASMVGIDIGGGNNGLFSGDNILEIYKSQKMLRKVLLSSAEFNGKKELLIDRYIAINELGKKWDQYLKAPGFSFADTNSVGIVKDSLLNVAIKDLNKQYLTVGKLDKKSSIIKVSVSSEDELFAKELTESVVSTVNDFYIQSKTKRSLDNLKILQHQTDSVKAVMNGAIYKSAVTIDATPNLNPTRQVLRTAVQRSQFDAEANKAILQELVKNLEISKISFRKEVPLIQVIDEPMLPLEKDKTSRAKGLVFGGLLFGFMAVFYFFIRKSIS